jgi:hypothetical protein
MTPGSYAISVKSVNVKHLAADSFNIVDLATLRTLHSRVA